MVEEEDDLLLDAEEASAIDQNKTTEHSVIAMAWSHSKAPQGLLILAFASSKSGFRNTGRKNATNFKSVKIYLDRVILKNEENVLPAASVTIALDSKGPLLREGW